MVTLFIHQVFNVDLVDLQSVFSRSGPRVFFPSHFEQPSVREITLHDNTEVLKSNK